MRQDGSTSQISDIWFQQDLMDTINLNQIPIEEDISTMLDMPGMGNVLSFHQVMANDDTNYLKDLLNQFISVDFQTARNLTWDIIYAWTGVTDLSPDSRGPYLDDARKLYAMEKLWGENFLSLTCNYQYIPEPHSNDVNKLNIIFNDWENKFFSYLMLNTTYNDLYSIVTGAIECVKTGVNYVDASNFILDIFHEFYSSENELDKEKLYNFLSLY
jgi:hypothetical protein